MTTIRDKAGRLSQEAVIARPCSKPFAARGQPQSRTTRLAGVKNTAYSSPKYGDSTDVLCSAAPYNGAIPYDVQEASHESNNHSGNNPPMAGGTQQGQRQASGQEPQRRPTGRVG